MKLIHSECPNARSKLKTWNCYTSSRCAVPLSFQAKLCFSVDKTKLLTFYFQIQLWRQNTKVLLLSLWKLLSTSCDHSNVGPSVALSHGTNYLDCSYENQWCCTTTQQRNPPQRYLNGTTIYSVSGRSSNFGVCGEYKLDSSRLPFKWNVFSGIFISYGYYLLFLFSILR